MCGDTMHEEFVVVIHVPGGKLKAIKNLNRKSEGKMSFSDMPQKCLLMTVVKSYFTRNSDHSLLQISRFCIIT